MVNAGVTVLVKKDSNNIEACFCILQIVGGKPSLRRTTYLALLERGDTLLRQTVTAASTGFHFYKDSSPPMPGNDINFATPAPIIVLDDVKALATQILSCQPLTLPPQRLVVLCPTIHRDFPTCSFTPLNVIR